MRWSGLVAIVALLGSGLAASAQDKDAEKKQKEKEKKQAAVLKMRDEALADLYKQKPETTELIKAAAGYAVFDNTGIHLLLFATSRGNGVAVDQSATKPTFMKMTTVGAGPGLGVKDYRVIFVFRNAATLRKFIDSGWDFGGEADAAAKTKKEGGAASASGSATSDMSIYTITKKGVALQATLGGTKFSKDDELN
jgi:lipid-binding SYLF domain-containing protein